MRRLVIRLVPLLVVAGGLMAIGDVAAYADTVCQQTNPATGECLIWVQAPGSPSGPGNGGSDGPKDTGTGSACYWDGTQQGISNPPPGPVPCSNGDGYWSNGHNCYISAVDPPPPAGDPSWQGHDPGDGAVYECYQPQTHLDIMLWSADSPPSSGTGPTPREVAQLAIADMQLRAIDIGVAPEPGEDSIGIVGMPAWMWAANPDSHTVGPITESASAGGTTVTATAKLQKITWDMGDGSAVTCTTPGTPYKAAYGSTKSPDCGHVYERSSSTKSGGKYTVTATSDWVITWEGAGQSGTIRLNGLTRSVAIAVGEAQVLVQ